MGIHAISEFSLLDYPNELSAIVWIATCNLRCSVCHNKQIIKGKTNKTDQELLDFLETRKKSLTAVVFSGGEATNYKHLPELITKVKSMGFKTKLDTNGTRPDVIRKLLENNSLDYVALDYKGTPKYASKITGKPHYFEKLQFSLVHMLNFQQHGGQLEVRTTFHPDLMTTDMLDEIIDDLDCQGYTGVYYIQNVVTHGDKTLGDVPKPVKTLSLDQLKKPKNFSIKLRNFK